MTERVGKRASVGDVNVFMEIDICDGYLPATNMSLKDSALEINEKVSKKYRVIMS